jgi:SAM-dependent methyltransferase
VPLAVHSDRLRARAADIFTPWPVRGDLIILARVLHDWDDPEALAILRHARAALNPGGRLAIVEMLRDPIDHGGALCDLHLLAVTGGRERTLGEFNDMLEKSGFHAASHEPLATIPQLLLATPQ